MLVFSIDLVNLISGDFNEKIDFSDKCNSYTKSIRNIKKVTLSLYLSNTITITFIFHPILTLY